jgi:hypothetical protein
MADGEWACNLELFNPSIAFPRFLIDFDLFAAEAISSLCELTISISTLCPLVSLQILGGRGASK